MGDFNTSLTTLDSSTKQKISKETQTLNDTMDQLDLIDIYRTFHPKTMTILKLKYIKLIHRNPLHSYTLTMKKQKEKLRKQSHSPLQ